MFRLWVLIALAALSACGGPSDRQLEREFTTARDAMLRGELADAAALADRVIAATQSRPSEAVWQLRLLRAEVAVLQRRFSEATPVLHAELPAGENFDRLRAQQKYVEARMFVSDSRFADAIEALSRGRPLAPPDSGVRLDIDEFEGQCLLRLGRWGAAESILTGVLARAQAAHDQYRQAAVLNDLGMSRYVRSRYDEALPFFERVMAFDDLKDLTVYAISMSNAGACYSRLGQLDRALTIEQRAFEIHERRGPRLYFVQALGQLGNLHVLRGEPSESLTYYERALHVARDANLTSEAELWAGNLATAYTDLRQWDNADRLNEEAKRLWESTRSGKRVYYMLNSAAIATGRGQLDTAQRLYEEALAARDAPPSVLWDAHFGLAGIATALKDTARAQKEFEAALNVIETTRAGLLKTDYKVSYLTQLIAFYQAYVQMLIDSGQSDRALEVADSSRGKVLAERGGRANGPARASVAAFRRLAAQSHAVLLSYWLTRDRSYVWVITGDAVRCIPLPAATEIAPLVRAHQATIANAMADPLTGTETAGDKLYRLLVAPVAQWLPANAQVVIVPDGALHGINFETLPVSGSRRHYWIEDVEIEIAPSLATLAVGPSPGAAPSLLLIGNAQSHPPDFPALRYAPAEMSAVARHFGTDRVTEFEAVRASPDAYRAAHPDRFGYIHFTAHATTSADSPLDSAVVLSGPENAYKLYAREVADQPLGAELVTVSACRSAGERAYAGEGLVGFSWAFLRAGARRVVAGLWDVDDRSTPEVMDQLYANLVAGDRPSRALRKAKLAMVARGGSSASPYRWAPFELFTVTP